MESQIRSLIKKSMQEKNKTALVTYKSILENAQKIAKTKGADVQVTDDMVIKAIQNEIRQLKDVEQYCSNDPARLSEISCKVGYCEALLPQMASDDEVMTYLTENQVEKNIGMCMKSLKEHFGSKLDGKAASAVAKRYVSM